MFGMYFWFFFVLFDIEVLLEVVYFEFVFDR